jgi:hypothetical protein
VSGRGQCELADDDAGRHTEQNAHGLDVVTGQAGGETDDRGDQREERLRMAEESLRECPGEGSGDAAHNGVAPCAAPATGHFEREGFQMREGRRLIGLRVLQRGHAESLS